MGSAVKPFTSCSWPLRRSPYTCFGGSSEAKQLRKAFYFIFSTYFLYISFNFHLICFEEIHYLHMSTLDLKYQISHRFVELFAAAHSAHIIFTQLLGVCQTLWRLRSFISIDQKQLIIVTISWNRYHCFRVTLQSIPKRHLGWTRPCR